MDCDEHARQMSLRRTFGGILRRLAALAFFPLALGAASGFVSGAFALQAGEPATHGFLRATPAEGNPLRQHLDIWMADDEFAPAIRHYTVDMTKLLHLIIVSDDFTTFLHVHPTLGSNGHFTIDQTLPRATLYHIYADADPQGIGQQVFRFDLPLGPKASAETRNLSPTGPAVSTGPYTVTLSTTTLSAGKDAPLVVRITRDGRPATGLHPYLGALAHAVFLNASDLSYVHAHPMPLDASSMDSMSGMGGMSGMSGMSGMAGMSGMSGMDMKPLPDSATSSPNMQLHLMLREPGTYKLWLQFRGGSDLYVAPFVMTVR
jgi:hypothetical protein